MPFALDARHYATVAVLFWPILFLRLWALHTWCVLHDRDVLFAITHDGRLIIQYISADPADLTSWLARNRCDRPHLAMLDNADGAREASPIVILVARAFERFGCFLRYVWVGWVARPVPALQDSS